MPRSALQTALDIAAEHRARVAALEAENAHLEKVVAARDAQLNDEIAATRRFASDVLRLGAENAALREAGRRLGNAAMALHDHPDHPEAKPFVHAEYDRMGALLQGQGGGDA